MTGWLQECAWRATKMTIKNAQIHKDKENRREWVTDSISQQNWENRKVDGYLA